MRRLGFVFLALVCLAACQIGGGAGRTDAPKTGLMGAAVEVTTLAPLPADAAPTDTAPTDAAPAAGSRPAPETPRPAAETATGEPAPVAGTEVPAPAPPAPDAPEAPDGAEPAATEPQSPAQVACLKSGGLWSRAESGVAFCQRITKDGGKSCSMAGDCEGYCLAPSRSCAPVTPVFGCNKILDELGRAITECVE